MTHAYALKVWEVVTQWSKSQYKKKVFDTEHSHSNNEQEKESLNTKVFC